MSISKVTIKSGNKITIRYPGPQGPAGAGGGGGDGSGDVVGPASSVSGNLPTFSGTTGKVIQDGGVSVAAVRDRATHTGVQAIATVTGLQAALDGKEAVGVAATALAAHVAAADPHPNYALDSDLTAKANIASPTFTGTPAAPTAAADVNTTQIATTAFVQQEIANDTTRALASHQHNASAINVGILPVARGGTGIDGSTAANGEILIGNGTGFAKGTLTAGTNITISNSAGGITINSTGAGGGGTPPTGTGFYHVTSGAMDPAAVGETGTGSVVLANSPNLTTPNIGAATATTVNKVTITQPATSATLTISDGKTLACNNSFTFLGNDGKTLNFSNSLQLSGVDGSALNVGIGGALYFDVLTSTVSTDIDDFSPSGLAYAGIIQLNPSTSIKFGGLIGGSAGRTITLVNASTDSMIMVTNQSSTSSAANRILLATTLPLFMMPGESISLTYDATASRWRLSTVRNFDYYQFDEWNDYTSITGPLTTFLGSGTGASGQAGTFGANSTEKAVGVYQADTGTTATGSAGVGASANNLVPPGQGCALYLCRVSPESLSDGTNTFALFSGFHDAAGAANVSDGVYWSYRQTNSTNWQRSSSAASTRTETPTSVTVTTTYVWLGIFINANWSRADYFVSENSIDWEFAGSNNTNMPSSTQLVNIGTTIVKSFGITQNNAAIDFQAWRYDIIR